MVEMRKEFIATELIAAVVGLASSWQGFNPSMKVMLLGLIPFMTFMVHMELEC